MPSSFPLRAGVIGAGPFGRLHAQKYAASHHVCLVGIADLDGAKAQALAKEFSVRAFGDPAELLHLTDLVTVATPAITHAAVAEAALRAGKHVLVEKPIAVEVADADRLIALAETRGLILQAGHQERLVFAAAGLLSRKIAPLKIESVRANTFAARALDVSVAHDLMIHDVDLVHLLYAGEIAQIRASERPGPGGKSDEVEAFLTFDNGAEAHFLASRMAQERRRFMHVTYPDGHIRIDFLSRIVENTTPENLPALFKDGAAAHPDVADPLGAAVNRFIAAVRGEGTVLAPAREARRALVTINRILDAARTNKATP